MSDAITELSGDELDAVGAGLSIKAYVDLSTNISHSKIYQSNYSKVYAGAYNTVTVIQSNSVGTTVNFDG
jgi:hypothetical protein